MLVFMPKYRHYDAIREKMLHSVRQNINNAINKFKSEEDKIEVFIEDELATNFFKERELFTFTRESELQAVYNFDFYGDYMASIESMYPSARKFTLDFKKIQMPDRKLLYTDIDAYTKQYMKLYHERGKDCIQTLLKEEKKFAMIFTYRGKNDNPIIPKFEENDGILYIYCDIETGIISGQYSGIWITPDMIETIL